MKTPEDLKYTREDVWVILEAEIATIGITDYAQDQLSDVVFVEILVSAGKMLESERLIARVESVKTASDVASPISGTVTEVNDQVIESPELLNTDPYGQAWLLKVKIESATVLKDLMDAKAYQIYRSEQ